MGHDETNFLLAFILFEGPGGRSFRSKIVLAMSDEDGKPRVEISVYPPRLRQTMQGIHSSVKISFGKNAGRRGLLAEQ